MFDFRRALKSALQTHPDDELVQLLTPWGEVLDPHDLLQEYPRPQMRRESYANLNGWWECTIRTDQQEGSEADPIYCGRILVPFSPESALSGVGHQLLPHETIWYRRSVSMLKRPGKRYLLHFGAVDFACECIVNGHPVGSHRGGYTPFSFRYHERPAVLRRRRIGRHDRPRRTRPERDRYATTRPSNSLDRGSIWYTAQSGIWQTVWMEEVSDPYIEKLDIRHRRGHTAAARARGGQHRRCRACALGRRLRRR